MKDTEPCCMSAVLPAAAQLNAACAYCQIQAMAVHGSMLCLSLCLCLVHGSRLCLSLRVVWSAGP